MADSKYQKALIGAVLHPDPQLDFILESGITRNDFTGKCKVVWEIIETLYSENIPVNYLKLMERVSDKYYELLEECSDSCVSVAFTEDNIECLKLETLTRVASEVAYQSYQKLEGLRPDDAEEVISGIQKAWLELRVDRSKDIPVHEHMASFIKQCEEGGAGVVPWFLPALQHRCGNLIEEFIVIHAQPSIGKTALALQWMTYLIKHNFKPALASLESSTKALAPRLISHIGQVNSLHMKSGNYTSRDTIRAISATEKAQKMNYVIKDGSMTEAKLMAWCRIQKQNGVQIIFIDNLRHIDSVNSYDSEIRKLMELSLCVKRIRDAIGIPVVLFHHSNEEGDVGWCKDIKKDADIIIYLDRAGENITDGVDHVDWVFQKGRDLGTFTIDTLFDKNIQTYKQRGER